MQSALCNFVPSSTAVIRPHSKPWYSSYLRRIAKQRDRLFRRSRGLHSEHRLAVGYRRVRNWYVAELRHAERMNYIRQGCRLSSKELWGCTHRWWAVAKSACGLQSRDSIPPLADSGCVAISSLDKADRLNRAFAAQCSAPSSTQPTLPMDPSGSKFTFSMISVADVLKRLASLNVWKASGLDELPNGFLKECRFAIAQPLTHIF